MQGKATIAGHPIHPMLVTFPIGCFVAAIVCDIISIWAGPAFWAPMGTWLLVFGLIGALIASFFGLVDYLTAPMTARAKNTAAWHMTLNIAMIVIFGVACAVRFHDHASVAGYALTVLGIIVLCISGTLGGDVAHRHLVGSTEEEALTPRRAEEETSYREVSRPSASRR